MKKSINFLITIQGVKSWRRKAKVVPCMSSILFPIPSRPSPLSCLFPLCLWWDEEAYFALLSSFWMEPRLGGFLFVSDELLPVSSAWSKPPAVSMESSRFTLLSSFFPKGSSLNDDRRSLLLLLENSLSLLLPMIPLKDGSEFEKSEDASGKPSSEFCDVCEEDGWLNNEEMSDTPSPIK